MNPIESKEQQNKIERLYTNNNPEIFYLFKYNR